MLTLGKFRELTKDMPDDTTMNTTVEFGKEWSLRGSINCIHVCSNEHSYSSDSHIILTQQVENKDKVIIRKLVGKNKWETEF